VSIDGSLNPHLGPASNHDNSGLVLRIAPSQASLAAKHYNDAGLFIAAVSKPDLTILIAGGGTG